MDEVAEGVLRIAAKALLAIVRFLIWLAWEVMCETLLWYIGWPVVRVITFGTFPKQGITNGDEAEPLVFFWVAVTGLASLLVAAFVLARYLGQ